MKKVTAILSLLSCYSVCAMNSNTDVKNTDEKGWDDICVSPASERKQLTESRGKFLCSLSQKTEPNLDNEIETINHELRSQMHLINSYMGENQEYINSLYVELQKLAQRKTLVLAKKNQLMLCRKRISQNNEDNLFKQLKATLFQGLIISDEEIV